MKKIILLTLFLSVVCFGKIRSNPIVAPPVTLELYFDNDDWFIEFLFGSNVGVFTSDSLMLITSTDTVFFKPGFVIPQDVPFVINADSLLFPLSIAKSGDFVWVAQKYSGFYLYLDFEPMIFGNIAGAQVTAPQPGQSVKRISCYDPYFQSNNYYVVKDNNPTLGSDPFNAELTTSFSGYTYDSNHNPLPYVYFYGNHTLYCAPGSQNTDPAGYFERQDYSYIIHLCFQQQYCETVDTVFAMEPDSDYFMEFTFDSCFVGWNDGSLLENYSMQIFPNPGSENFTFHINSPFSNKDQALIKIYNAAGEIVNIIPVNSAGPATTVNWDGKGRYSDLPAGLYTCTLTMNDHVVASQKLVLEK